MKFNTFFCIVLTLISPGLYSQSIEGIDISHWQGNIDWVQAKTSGIDFAYVRASYDSLETDTAFLSNMTHGLSAGVAMGAYCYARPYVNAANSAQHFVNTAGPYIGQGFLPPAINIDTKDGLSNYDLNMWIQEWIAELFLLTGAKPVILTGAYFGLNFYPPLDNYPLWTAQWGATYPTNLGIWYDWLFWQYSAAGTVPGIAGQVNLDIFNGDSIAFDSLLNLGASDINDQHTNHKLKVFPNPASDEIWVIISYCKQAQLSIYNIHGQLFLKQKLNKSYTEINISQLPKGTYLLKCIESESRIMRLGKFVKE